MEKLDALAPDRIAEFLSGSAEIEFSGQKRREKYAWVQSTVVEQGYFCLAKKERGAVRALLAKVTALSMPQITRLLRSYRKDGEIRVYGGARRRFPVTYTQQDLELLIEVDRAHQRLSGPATRRILQREWQVFGRKEYARLAEISVAHLYNLRDSVGYRRRAAEFTQTRPSPIAIGERRRPDPCGRPGYLRVDNSPSRGLGRGKGRLSPQRRGCCNAVGDRRLRAADQRTTSAPSAGGHAASVPVSDSGFPRR